MPHRPAPTAAGLPRPERLTDRVTAALARLAHQSPPGTRLPTETDLAVRFGVSRTVVRESVARLQHEGLVAPRQGSGVYVREPNRHMPFRLDPGREVAAGPVLEIVELRRGLEAEAAALAAARRTRAQMAGIRAALRAIAREEAAGRDGVADDMAF